jgi:hypothetical protein
MKRWWLLGLLAGIFTVLGVVLAVLFRGDGPAGIAVGGLFLVIGLGMAWSASRMRREEGLDEIPPPEPKPGGRPWPEVAERIRARFEGTPFVVESVGSVIRVRADLADAAFLTWAAAHRVSVVHGVEAAATASGQAITRDFSQGFELTAGAGRLTGSASMSSGRSWSYSRRIELGVGPDGSFGKQVDIDFSSSAVQRPVDEVLRETGWRTSWWAALPAEAKGGLVMGVIGGVGGLAAAVAALVQALS